MNEWSREWREKKKEYMEEGGREDEIKQKERERKTKEREGEQK